MSLARESLEAFEPAGRRLGPGVLLAGAYWLAAALASARAYAVAFHRYEPGMGTDPLALTVAQDAGLWAATATVAAAFILFLALLALSQAAGRILRVGRRPGA
jgi:hypothetical protein